MHLYVFMYDSYIFVCIQTSSTESFDPEVPSPVNVIII